MQPSAHISATIECFDHLLSSWHMGKALPADIVLDRYFRARRYMGSKDRGQVAELFYWTLRNLAPLDWWCRHSGGGYHAVLPFPPSLHDNRYCARLLILTALIFHRHTNPAQLATLFTGGQYCPPILTDGEWQYVHRLQDESLIHDSMPQWVRQGHPEWLGPLLEAAFKERASKELQALNTEAPVDLRTNTLKTTREELLQQLGAAGFKAEPTPISPIGIRLHKRGAIFATPMFKEGQFEMQDEGSQIAALMVDAKPGQRVIDFCAGSGGKTLAIAAQMHNKGRILAFDTSAKRLGELSPRLKRAGVDNVEHHVIASESDQYLKRHKQTADRVIVDAPCSGVGTWRRNPDLKWRTTEKDIQELLGKQQAILASAARLVKPGGRLIYVTCSLLPQENENQVENFLSMHPNFRVVCAKKIWNKEEVAASAKPSYLWLSPAEDGTDGFFTAVLERGAA